MASAAVAASTTVGRLPVTIWTDDQIELPPWVVDHASYRRWARSDHYPRHGRIAYLNGSIWMDLSMEQVFSHNAVKTRITTVLDALVFEEKLGRVFSDRLLLSHAGAGLSCEPDACFVSYESVRQKRVRYVKGEREGIVELEGSPDMTLEVVSTASVRKDTVTLRKLYWNAGVSEYWLVDARRTKPELTILRWEKNGYREVQPLATGWIRSEVYARSFRIKLLKDPFGDPLYHLQARAKSR